MKSATILNVLATIAFLGMKGAVSADSIALDEMYLEVSSGYVDLSLIYDRASSGLASDQENSKLASLNRINEKSDAVISGILNINGTRVNQSEGVDNCIRTANETLRQNKPNDTDYAKCGEFVSTFLGIVANFIEPAKNSSLTILNRINEDAKSCEPPNNVTTDRLTCIASRSTGLWQMYQNWLVDIQNVEQHDTAPYYRRSRDDCITQLENVFAIKSVIVAFDARKCVENVVNNITNLQIERNI